MLLPIITNVGRMRDMTPRHFVFVRCLLLLAVLVLVLMVCVIMNINI